MNWYQFHAAGQHGYPQPEDSYKDLIYRDHCPRCGIHGPQTAPFRFRGEPKAKYSQVLQLNWVFDVFFVRPEVVVDMQIAGITGVGFREAVDHRSGNVLSSVVQLVIGDIDRKAMVEQLPSVTCRVANEETHLGLSAPPDTGVPYCGVVKRHPPTTLGIPEASLSGAPDFFQTNNWFGSGGSAWRATVISERVASLFRDRKWRGGALHPIAINSQSHRAI